jgi:hypothetical protein
MQGLKFGQRIVAVTMLGLLPLSLGCHCDSDTCSRLGRYGERFALHADACCGLNDPELQDQCVLDLLVRIDNAENILEQLAAACRNNDADLIEKLLKQLSGLSQNIILTNMDGVPVNGLPVLLETDSIEFFMTWSHSRNKVSKKSLATVNGTVGLAAAAGPKVVNSGLPMAVIEVNSFPLQGVNVQEWRLDPGSSIDVIVEDLAVNLSVSGTVAFSESEFELASGQGYLPTAVDLLVQWGDVSVRCSLDESCTWNRVTSTELQLGLRPVAIEGRVHAELLAYPTIFAVIPFASNLEDGSAVSATDGAVSGTQVFHTYYEGLGSGAYDSVGSLSNCDDADGDGISNLAETIRKSYKTRLEDLCGSQN